MEQCRRCSVEMHTNTYMIADPGTCPTPLGVDVNEISVRWTRSVERTRRPMAPLTRLAAIPPRRTNTKILKDEDVHTSCNKLHSRGLALGS